MLTLEEKASILDLIQSPEDKETVRRSIMAVPSKSEWKIPDECPDELAREASAILCQMLSDHRSQKWPTETLGENVYDALIELAERHEYADLILTDGAIVIGLFFSLNEDPSLYDPLRFHMHRTMSLDDITDPEVRREAEKVDEILRDLGLSE